MIRSDHVEMCRRTKVMRTQTHWWPSLRWRWRPIRSGEPSFISKWNEKRKNSVRLAFRANHRSPSSASPLRLLSEETQLLEWCERSNNEIILLLLEIRTTMASRSGRSCQYLHDSLERWCIHQRNRSATCSNVILPLFSFRHLRTISISSNEAVASQPSHELYWITCFV